MNDDDRQEELRRQTREITGEISSGMNTLLSHYVTDSEAFMRFVYEAEKLLIVNHVSVTVSNLLIITAKRVAAAAMHMLHHGHGRGHDKIWISAEYEYKMLEYATFAIIHKFETEFIAEADATMALLEKNKMSWAAGMVSLSLSRMVLRINEVQQLEFIAGEN